MEKKQMAIDKEKRRKMSDEETVQLVGYSSDSAEESLITEPSSSMASASQNSPKSDPEARKDTGSDTITLILPRNFISYQMITATADRTKLSNLQLMMNAFAILVLGWFCINKKELLLTNL